jgi:hypothetical protein
MITPKDKAEELLMYYMQVPTKDGGYTINIDHGKRNAFKAIIEVQYGIAETGRLSGFWYQTGEELERIYTKYKHEYKDKDAK